MSVHGGNLYVNSEIMYKQIELIISLTIILDLDCQATSRKRYTKLTIIFAAFGKSLNLFVRIWVFYA